MCAPHAEQWQQIHGVPKGFLSVDLWRDIVDGFVKDNVVFDHIIFQWLGDPLFHPKIHQILFEAQRLKGQVDYLRLDSNMILLDENRTRHILESAENGGIPLLLVASIDANTIESYVEVKGFDRLQLVRENIRRLLRMRKQMGVCVNLQIQFVVQDGNASEVSEFRRYWLDLLGCYSSDDRWHDEIMFKRLSVDGGGVGQEIADRLYHESVLEQGIKAENIGGVSILVWENKPWQQTVGSKQISRAACPGLWSTPVIRHDGALMYCCADLQGQMKLGNLDHSSFLNLWLSDSAKTRRREHLRGQFSDACATCGGINWYDLPTHHRQMV